MPRRFARENFTSGRRRRPISSSMLKVPNNYSRTRLGNWNSEGKRKTVRVGGELVGVGVFSVNFSESFINGKEI